MKLPMTVLSVWVLLLLLVMVVVVVVVGVVVLMITLHPGGENEQDEI